MFPNVTGSMGDVLFSETMLTKGLQREVILGEGGREMREGGVSLETCGANCV